MTTSQPAANVRKATRWLCKRMPIIWQRQKGKAPRRHGFLHDISAVGMAYLSPRKTAPNLGDRITIMPRRSGDAILGRVVRIKAFSDWFCLVGCERLDIASSHLMPIPAVGRTHCTRVHRAQRPDSRAA
jgi:hypothetical protein